VLTDQARSVSSQVIAILQVIRSALFAEESGDARGQFRFCRRFRSDAHANSTGTFGCPASIGRRYVTERELNPKGPGVDAVVSKLP
jgi:hypothetical protein